MPPAPPSRRSRTRTRVGWALVGCAALVALVYALPQTPFWIGLGESRHATSADVPYVRVRRCLPPGATDITLHQELNGHCARYRVSETDFHGFLDALWQANEGSSAHPRDAMSGEGEPADPARLANRFAPFGWQPLENAVTFYGPSESSGAITVYYYDRGAGIAYHDTGYW